MIHRSISSTLLTLLLSCASLLLSAEDANKDMLGYRGGVHRTASFEGPLPPTTCDGKTGENIRWRLPLPNWGYGHPIIVAGKIFLTYEGGWGKYDFPALLSVDLQSGKIDWELELNHLEAIGASQVQSEWAKEMDILRKLYGMFYQWQAGDDAAKKAVEAGWAEMGFEWKGYKPGYGALRRLKGGNRGKLSQDAKAAGLALETWQQELGMGLGCFGQTFPTPVSDGKDIYVATAFGSFFKVGLDGTIAWITSDVGEQGEYCRNGRSPLLYGDMLISDVQSRVRAIDKNSGKVLWGYPVGAETWMSPVVITVDGTDILLCFNKQAFRLPDGEPLKLSGGTDFGALTVVDPQQPDVTYHTGGGEHGGWENKGNNDTPPPSCVQWTLSGKNLQGKVLWSGISGERLSTHTGLTLHAGKLYHAESILDPHSGKVIKGTPGDKKARLFEVEHLLIGIGDRLYGLREHNFSGGKHDNANLVGGAEMVVFDLDGKKIGSGILPAAESTSEKVTQVSEQTGGGRWRFSYAYPFTIGEGCVIVRGNDDLWCIAE